MSDSEFSDDYVKLLLDRANSIFSGATASESVEPVEVPKIPKTKKQSALDLKREQVRLKLLEARSKPKVMSEKEEYASIKKKLAEEKNEEKNEEPVPKSVAKTVKKRAPVRVRNYVPQESDSDSEDEFDKVITGSSVRKVVEKPVEKVAEKVVPKPMASSVPELPKKNKLFSPYHSFASKNGFLN